MALVLHSGCRAPRLRKSVATPHELVPVVKEWFAATNECRAFELVKSYHNGWSWKSMPTPKQLCERTPYALAEIVSSAFPDLNPGLLALTDALLGINKQTQCLFSTSIDVEARVVAGCMPLRRLNFRLNSTVYGNSPTESFRFT